MHLCCSCCVHVDDEQCYLVRNNIHHYNLTPYVLRFGGYDYITDPLVSLTKMINLSTDELGAGVAASITYVSWMVFICFCFKKSEGGRSKTSRFDKVIEEAQQEGKVKLPEQSFDPPEPEKYDPFIPESAI